MMSSNKKATLRLAITAIFGILLSFSHAGFGQSTKNLSYSTKCETCHGSKGLADTSPGKLFHMKPLTDPAVVAMTDSELKDVITNGSGKMPAYKEKLSDAEIQELMQYIHQLQNSGN